MPAITISRADGWADRFKRYAVLVDGHHRGDLGRSETLSIDVPHGSHHVQLRAGPLVASATLRVHVDERGAALSCGCNKRLALALVQMGRPDTWIWLRAVP